MNALRRRALPRRCKRLVFLSISSHPPTSPCSLPSPSPPAVLFQCRAVSCSPSLSELRLRRTICPSPALVSPPLLHLHVLQRASSSTDRRYIICTVVACLSNSEESTIRYASAACFPREFPQAFGACHARVHGIVSCFASWR